MYTGGPSAQYWTQEGRARKTAEVRAGGPQGLDTQPPQNTMVKRCCSPCSPFFFFLPLPPAAGAPGVHTQALMVLPGASAQ